MTDPMRTRRAMLRLTASTGVAAVSAACLGGSRGDASRRNGSASTDTNGSTFGLRGGDPGVPDGPAVVVVPLERAVRDEADGTLRVSVRGDRVLWRRTNGSRARVGAASVDAWLSSWDERHQGASHAVLETGGDGAERRVVGLEIRGPPTAENGSDAVTFAVEPMDEDLPEPLSGLEAQRRSARIDGPAEGVLYVSG